MVFLHPGPFARPSHGEDGSSQVTGPPAASMQEFKIPPASTPTRPVAQVTIPPSKLSSALGNWNGAISEPQL